MDDKIVCSAPPHASMMLESLRGLGYSPEMALADLVDNSLAAGASRLLHLGIVDTSVLNDYGKFSLEASAMYKITDDFPAIMTSKLSPQVLNVRYEIDVTSLERPKENICQVLYMGGYKNGTV